ncbi:MAG: hypothetical protein ABEH83_06120 [Halobacterium sp.]
MTTTLHATDAPGSSWGSIESRVGFTVAGYRPNAQSASTLAA